MDPVKNFAKVTVSTGYNESAVTIVLSSGHGAKFPDPATQGAFNLVWFNATDYADPSDDPNVEIVRCTARSTDILTVTRGQEGIASQTHNTGGKVYKMMLAFTKKTMDDFESIFAGTKTISKLNIKGGTTVSDIQLLIQDAAGNNMIAVMKGAASGAIYGSLYIPGGDIVNVRNIQGGFPGLSYNLDLSAGGATPGIRGNVAFNWDVGRGIEIWDGSATAFTSDTVPGGLVAKFNRTINGTDGEGTIKFYKEFSEFGFIKIYEDGDQGNQISQIRIFCKSYTDRNLQLGYDGTLNAGFIQAAEQGVGWRSLLLNRLGGNVGIGKIPSTYPLEIDGDISIDTGHVFRVNAVQVVGARVIDDRIDDTIGGAWDAAAQGILDACRDAIISHGLVAAA